jgi:hypothetical protein
LEAADQVRAQAEADAQRTRAAVGKVGDRAETLSRRLDELAAAVSEAVAELRSELEALTAEAEPRDALIAEAEAAAARPPDVAEATRDDVPAPDEPEPEPEAAEPEPPAPAKPASPPVPEGARLLALKMALDGRPRDETAAYLEDNFELDDPQALLDEVYAQAGS